MANRTFQKMMALGKEIVALFFQAIYTTLKAATGTLNLTADIVLTKALSGAAANTNTFTLQVDAAAANPLDTVLAVFGGTAAATSCTITPNDGTNNPANTPAVAADALLNLTADITLTSVATGVARNTNTFTLQVEAAAANPTDTILAVFTGTAAAIVCTITPNDGTNNAATPVDLTTAELVELINTGAVVGKTVTVTDVGALRNDQTAAGGDATNLANAGEGDGVVGTFANGADEILVPVTLTTAELVELINTGAVVGKTVTITDAGALRNDQTAAGGDATDLADGGEGDGVVAIFSGGSDATFALSNTLGVTSVTQVSNGRYRITLDDAYYSLKGLNIVAVGTAENDHTFQLRDEAVATKTLDIILQSGDANLADQEEIYGTLYLKNSSQP